MWRLRKSRQQGQVIMLIGPGASAPRPLEPSPLLTRLQSLKGGHASVYTHTPCSSSSQPPASLSFPKAVARNLKQPHPSLPEHHGQVARLKRDLSSFTLTHGDPLVWRVSHSDP